MVVEGLMMSVLPVVSVMVPRTIRTSPSSGNLCCLFWLQVSGLWKSHFLLVNRAVIGMLQVFLIFCNLFLANDV